LFPALHFSHPERCFSPLQPVALAISSLRIFNQLQASQLGTSGYPPLILRNFGRFDNKNGVPTARMETQRALLLHAFLIL
jgi:hypothetical protein